MLLRGAGARKGMAGGQPKMIAGRGADRRSVAAPGQGSAVQIRADLDGCFETHNRKRPTAAAARKGERRIRSSGQGSDVPARHGGPRLAQGVGSMRRSAPSSSSSVSTYRYPSGPSRTSRIRRLNSVSIDSRRISSVLSLKTMR